MERQEFWRFVACTSDQVRQGGFQKQRYYCIYISFVTWLHIHEPMVIVLAYSIELYTYLQLRYIFTQIQLLITTG